MKKLEQKTAQRIEAALVRLAHEGHGDVQKLTDPISGLGQGDD